MNGALKDDLHSFTAKKFFFHHQVKKKQKKIKLNKYS